MSEPTILRIRSDQCIEIVKCSPRICGKIIPPGVECVHPVMALYVLYTNQGVMLDENGNRITIEEFIKRYGGTSLWITFSVYLDLRRRGKKPEPGLAQNELVLENERMRIYVFEENAPITPRKILELVERCLKQGYKVIVAVVDMYGDVTYYEVDKMKFAKQGESDVEIRTS